MMGRPTGRRPSDCHPEKPNWGRGFCKRCYESVKYTEEAPVRKARALKAYRDKRATVMTLLGDACAACGESDPVVLQIDHINGDGHLDGRNRTSKTLNAALKDPNRFQVLCANCHCRKTAADRTRSMENYGL